jgi:hypothetical protein
MRYIIPAALLLCCAITAQAQVYRCTGANGKVEFSDAPCATSSTDSRVVMPQAATGDRSLQMENERLRMQLLEEQNKRLRAENAGARDAAATPTPAPAPPAVGRTQADLQAERANTYECEQARRNYEVALSAVTGRSTAPAARAAMYSACGMLPPSVESNVNIRSAPGNCIRRGNILQCN